MCIEDFGGVVDQGCGWVAVSEDKVPVEQREEAERHVAEACTYFGLPPMTVRWWAWQGSGAPCGALADPELRGWVPDHDNDHRPTTAIDLRADLPDYPIGPAVRYATTRAQVLWKEARYRKLPEAALHEVVSKIYGPDLPICEDMSARTERIAAAVAALWPRVRQNAYLKFIRTPGLDPAWIYTNSAKTMASAYTEELENYVREREASGDPVRLVHGDDEDGGEKTWQIAPEDIRRFERERDVPVSVFARFDDPRELEEKAFEYIEQRNEAYTEMCRKYAEEHHLCLTWDPHAPCTEDELCDADERLMDAYKFGLDVYLREREGRRDPARFVYGQGSEGRIVLLIDPDYMAPFEQDFDAKLASFIEEPRITCIDVYWGLDEDEDLDEDPDSCEHWDSIEDQEEEWDSIEGPAEIRDF